MSIWISWVEVEGVLDILLFCTIDLTFWESLFSVVLLQEASPGASFVSSCAGEGEAADVSRLDGDTTAAAASLQPTAFNAGVKAAR